VIGGRKSRKFGEKEKYASNDVQKTVPLKIDLKPKTLGVE